MQSKTKIIVLHLKELIYTGIFVILGILFLLLLVIMFLPEKNTPPEAVSRENGIYIPGKYGTRIEDMVLICENGIKNFTKSPKNLIEL